MANNIPDMLKLWAQFDKLRPFAYKETIIDGVRIRNYGTDLMNNGGDWKYGCHKHHFYEFHYVTQGSVLSTIEGKDICPQAGQFYLIPPRTSHSHRQEPGTKHIGFATRWEFETEPNAGTEMMEMVDTFASADSSVMEDDGSVLKACMALLSMAEQGGSNIEMHLVFCQFLLSVVRFYWRGEYLDNIAQVDTLSIKKRIYKSAMQFIIENHKQKLEVADVAASVYISSNHLNKIFHEYTGHSIIWNIGYVRVGSAENLLAKSGKHISEIAYEVGFGSEAYFCTVFKKYMGVSPGEYRRALAEKDKQGR